VQITPKKSITIPGCTMVEFNSLPRLARKKAG
jgi:hypothetical protein